MVNSSTQLARSLTRQLIENGISDVVLSPGSRNSPMSIALYSAANEGLLELHVRIDERTAGFFALGIAKASKQPVALVCTSGTAVANYHPAILEAHHSQIPLLAITADRPARLRKTGANQTTVQSGIFGDAVTYSADIAEPLSDLHEVLLGLKNGPVHLNVQFDEPLLPDDQSDWLSGVVQGKPFEPTELDAEELLITKSRGVIVVGYDRGGLGAEEINKFALELGWPLIAEDPLSFAQAIPHTTIFLASEKIRKELLPEVAIVIGRTTLSRSTNALIKSAAYEIVIDPRIAVVDTERTADQLFLTLPVLLKQFDLDPEWATLWESYAIKTAGLLDSLPQWSESNIARKLGAILPSRGTIFVSSSRPIRDLEGFASPRGDIETFANRGLAGIDGNISTALGIASQRGSMVAVLGDLSFLHDLTGLIGTTGINLRILVINNDGGGIFSTLPQRGVSGFERIFGTPHGLDLAAIASSMGIPATTAADLNGLLQELLLPIEGLSVVVAKVPDREVNAQTLSDLKMAVDSI